MKRILVAVACLLPFGLAAEAGINRHSPEAAVKAAYAADETAIQGRGDGVMGDNTLRARFFSRSLLRSIAADEIIAGVRTDVLSFLDKHNFKYVPSVSNKFMVDVKRPGNEIIEAMRKEKIYIGRVWPSWPTYVRVSVGTQDEMNKFKTAFLKVMS